MPPALPIPTPAAVAGRRQIADPKPSTSYFTVSSAVDIATAAVHPTGSVLPLDSQGAAASSQRPEHFGAPTLGGTLTVTETTTTNAPAQTDPPTAPSASLHPSPSKPISTTTMVAVLVAVPLLCALLIGSVCWNRRRNKKSRVAARRDRRVQRVREMSIVGVHGFGRMPDTSTDSFKDDLSSHIPGSLPSPATIKYAFLERPERSEHHVLSKLSTPHGPKASASNARRISTKSTMTGKINPSNNFAAPSHDESHEDAWGEDARSMHSRHPLSPTSPSHGIGTMPSPLSSLTVSTTAGRLGGEPASFLTFMSGDGDGDSDEPHLRTGTPAGFVFVQGSPLRNGPTVQSTPTPKRALTQRSLKGGVPPAPEYMWTPKPPKANAALDNLIAALDQPEERRQSTYSDFQDS